MLTYSTASHFLQRLPHFENRDATWLECADASFSRLRILLRQTTSRTYSGGRGNEVVSFELPVGHPVEVVVGFLDSVASERDIATSTATA